MHTYHTQFHLSYRSTCKHMAWMVSNWQLISDESVIRFGLLRDWRDGWWYGWWVYLVVYGLETRKEGFELLVEVLFYSKTMILGMGRVHGYREGVEIEEWNYILIHTHTCTILSICLPISLLLRNIISTWKRWDHVCRKRNKGWCVRVWS